MIAAEIWKRRVLKMCRYPQWSSHLDEVFVKINGKLCYLWRAEILEAVVVKLGLAREIEAKPGAPIWRRYGAGQGYALCRRHRKLYAAMPVPNCV
jgi:hypothetical protein